MATRARDAPFASRTSQTARRSPPSLVATASTAASTISPPRLSMGLGLGLGLGQRGAGREAGNLHAALAPPPALLLPLQPAQLQRNVLEYLPGCNRPTNAPCAAPSFLQSRRQLLHAPGERAWACLLDSLFSLAMAALLHALFLAGVCIFLLSDWSKGVPPRFSLPLPPDCVYPLPLGLRLGMGMGQGRKGDKSMDRSRDRGRGSR